MRQPACVSIYRRRGRREAWPAVVAALLVGVLQGCGGNAGGAVSQAEVDTANALPRVLATVGGDQITMEDVRAQTGDELERMEAAYERSRHETIENAVRHIVGDRLRQAEMQKRGMTQDQLLEAEEGRSIAPTDSEVAAFYEANRARMRGRSLEESRQGISTYLLRTRRDEAMAKLDRRLEEEGDAHIYVSPYRVALHDEGAPYRGPADAPITLVEFSDFQCPFCKGFEQTLDQLRSELGDTLRIVFRQFPLTGIHSNAEKAAEASLCAQEQGKFWELHDLMFQEQDRLGEDDLKAKADRLGVDVQAFSTCLDSGRSIARIRADQIEGRRVGVDGTPAIFINGIPIPGGAVPHDKIMEAIRDELKRRGR